MFCSIKISYCFLVLIVTCSTLNAFSNYKVELVDDCPANRIVFDLRKLTGDIIGNPTDGGSKFSLLRSSPASKYFRIRNSNAKLMTAKEVDLDSMCSKVNVCCENKMTSSTNVPSDVCEFEIEISYLKDSSNLKRYTLTVRLRDRNDHAPKFKRDDKEHVIEIREDAKPSSEYSLPAASDLDYGPNRQLQYNIRNLEPENAFKKYFTLKKPTLSNSLGEDPSVSFPTLLLLKNLDYEKFKEFTFTLEARDSPQRNEGYASLTGTIKVVIKIIDMNDNAPQFTQRQYYKDVSEGDVVDPPRAVLFQLRATDRDSGENAEILYKFNPISDYRKSAEYVRVEENSGKIIQIKPFDYERQKSLVFQVVAFNRLPLLSNVMSPTATATMTITVKNVYDEKLTLLVDYSNDDKNYSIVKEGVNSAHIALVTVKWHEHSARSERIHCELDQRFKSYFSLNLDRKSGERSKNYQIKLIKPLDREKSSVINTFVQCRDSELTDSFRQQHNDWCQHKLQIRVLDINDNKPQFRPMAQLTKPLVRENSPVNTLVCQIEADDPDEGENGRVTYKIDKSDPITLEHLQISPSTGKITVRRPIDRESSGTGGGPLTQLPVIVTATDHGSPDQLSSEKTVHIIVLDVNDNLPQFHSNPMFFSVEENGPKYKSIGKIEVTDGDLNDKISVSILTPSPFTIVPAGPREFFLNTTISLDYEKKQKYTLTIVANDGQTHSSHRVKGHVDIAVLDKNDNSPIIITPSPNNISIFLVSYLEPVRHKVFKIGAYDQDISPMNSRLTCTIDLMTSPNSVSRGGTQNDGGGGRGSGISGGGNGGGEFNGRSGRSGGGFSDGSMRRGIRESDGTQEVSDEIRRNAGIRSHISGVGSQIGDFSFTTGIRDNIFEVIGDDMYVYIGRKMTSRDIGDYQILVTVMDNGQPQRKSFAYAKIVVDKSKPKSVNRNLENEWSNPNNGGNPDGDISNRGGGFTLIVVIIIIMIFFFGLIIFIVIFIVMPHFCHGSRRQSIRSCHSLCFSFSSDINHHHSSTNRKTVISEPITNNKLGDGSDLLPAEKKFLTMNCQSDNELTISSMHNNNNNGQAQYWSFNSPPHNIMPSYTELNGIKNSSMQGPSYHTPFYQYQTIAGGIENWHNNELDDGYRGATTVMAKPIGGNYSQGIQKLGPAPFAAVHHQPPYRSGGLNGGCTGPYKSEINLSQNNRALVLDNFNNIHTARPSVNETSELRARQGDDDENEPSGAVDCENAKFEADPIVAWQQASANSRSKSVVPFMTSSQQKMSDGSFSPQTARLFAVDKPQDESTFV